MQSHIKFDGGPPAASKSDRKRTRFFWMVVNKPEVFRKTGVLTVVNRFFARSTDDYHEVILDAHGDELRHETVEPLSEHQGHGSDRMPRPDGGSGDQTR